MLAAAEATVAPVINFVMCLGTRVIFSLHFGGGTLLAVCEVGRLDAADPVQRRPPATDMSTIRYNVRADDRRRRCCCCCCCCFWHAFTAPVWRTSYNAERLRRRRRMPLASDNARKQNTETLKDGDGGGNDGGQPPRFACDGNRTRNYRYYRRYGGGFRDGCTVFGGSAAVTSCGK